MTQPPAHDSHDLTHKIIVPGEAVWLEILGIYAELVSFQTQLGKSDARSWIAELVFERHEGLWVRVGPKCGTKSLKRLKGLEK